MKDKNVPPSVGEFAVGERDQLLARVAELEQQRDRREAVLRGAEYPLLDGFDTLSIADATTLGETVASMTKQLVADRDGLKVQLAALKQPSAGVDERAPDRDGLVAAVCVLKSQGLGSLAEAVSDALSGLDTWQARAQLAAPAGVVLPERKPANFHWNECIEEVKRLNAAAPTTAPMAERCDTCHGQGEIWSGENQYQGQFQPPEPVMLACPECGGWKVEPAHSDDVSVPRECICPNFRDAGKPGLCPIHDASYIKQQQQQARNLLNGGRS